MPFSSDTGWAQASLHPMCCAGHSFTQSTSTMIFTLISCRWRLAQVKRPTPFCAANSTFTQIRRRSTHYRASSFTFPAGTGLGPWNTRDHAVMGVVGQTLRIYNDDNANHRLHTDGVPFQHPAADTAPGTFSDFVLHDVFDLDTNPGLYDHDVGQTARFWISVRPAA